MTNQFSHISRTISNKLKKLLEVRYVFIGKGPKPCELKANKSKRTLSPPRFNKGYYGLEKELLQELRLSFLMSQELSL